MSKSVHRIDRMFSQEITTITEQTITTTSVYRTPTEREEQHKLLCFLANIVMILAFFHEFCRY